VQGIERGLQVLEAVADHQPVGVGELARVLGLSKSSVQRNLLGLADAGWIRAVGGEFTKWTLTTRALRVGLRGSSEGRLRELALEPMRTLRDLTDETVTLQVREGDRMVLIERVDSRQAVRSFTHLGMITPLPVTSGGQSVLALLPAEEQDRILAEPLARLTPLTVTDPDVIRERMAVVRERGYAVNIGQNRNDVCAVGTAVMDPSGREAVAALGISMPASRFAEDRVPWWGTQVVATAAALTALL
jgi:IclR family transcriptional regulator, acetate operon repressor